jgi:hypothetical protein
MRRALRCHDFRSGREAIRSQYREYWQGERQSHGRKLVPADVGRRGPTTLLGVTARIAARRNAEQGPACGDATMKARVSPAGGHACVPLQGRIQAHIAWNLLRLPRDTLSAGLVILAIWPAPSFASAPQRRAGTRLRDATAKVRCSPALRCAYVPSPGSHPSTKRLEPASPCAGPTILAVTHTCLIVLGALK